MSNRIRTPIGFTLLAIAMTGTLTAHGAKGAQAYIGDTGRPAELINRPSCDVDTAFANWYGCRPNEWPQARNHPTPRPRP